MNDPPPTNQEHRIVLVGRGWGESRLVAAMVNPDEVERRVALLLLIPVSVRLVDRRSASRESRCNRAAGSSQGAPS